MPVAQKQEVKSKVVNESQSLALMRNMFRLSISTICYTRNLFPQNCFTEKPYGGPEMPIVHQLESARVDENGQLEILHKDAFLLTQWLEKGVFEALEKKYLKSVTFAIIKGNDIAETLLETYSFSVNYTEVNGKLLPSFNGVIATKDNLRVN